MRYFYQCQDCLKHFEIVISGFGVRADLEYCPNCQSTYVKRIYDMPEVIYKGEGWAGKKSKK
jgi:putative FmdB family regulatory protein